MVLLEGHESRLRNAIIEIYYLCGVIMTDKLRNIIKLENCDLKENVVTRVEKGILK